MLGWSHAASGLVAGAAVGDALHWPPAQTAALAGFTAGMALLPDLDQHGSCASRSLGFLSEAIAWVIHKVCLGHRGLTHTWMGILGFGLVALLGGYFRHDVTGKVVLGLLVMIAATGALEALHIARSGPADVIGAGVAALVVFYGWDLALVTLAAPLGVACHQAGDGLTKCGIPWLRPFTQHDFHLLPRRLQFTTGTWPEHLIVAPVILGALAVLAVQAADPGLLAAGWHDAAAAIGH